MTATEMLVPALRATMGDNVYYISFLRMKDVADRVSLAEEIHKNTGLRELIQRRVTNRSKEISTYLRTQSQRFFNALIIGVYGGSPEWYELSVGKSDQFDPSNLPSYQEGVLGMLKLAGSEKLFAIDGQHRVAGIKDALTGEPVPGLADEEVCTIFLAADVRQEAGLERTRRLFSTLNRYAKPVDMMDIIALDEDDAVAIVTRRLMEEYPLFKEFRISVSKGKAIPVTDKKCFTNITTLYEANDIILATDRGRKWKDFKRFRPTDVRLAGLYGKATEFWNLIVKNFPPLAEVQDSVSEDLIAGKYRHKGGGHLLFRTIGLLSFVRAVRMATQLEGTLSTWIPKFARLPIDLASEPWVGVLWEPTANVMITRKENQRTATLLLLYMLGIDLARLRTSVVVLKERYASALNRTIAEVDLPKRIT
ncbi:MAG: DGQHR domain-containing protein [Chloroflexi bacterium]|nr:DGQHR domain-containing protein [Chloroflexota bacterium]